MAYFECIIGGAGTTLTVTCDSVFAGKTITCTNGTTTLTAVCPSASPYVVEFDVETDGIWTISGIVNGKTHSISITLNTSGTLHEIPTGSSATPVANVQTWLHCANIWNKSYTTIAQVLADASTLQALIASNNAADYMARSTSWASAVTANSSAMTYIGANNYCANKLLANSTWLNAICNSTYFESVLNVKVPTMTSDTTPSGVASATNTYGIGYEAFRAFDGNDSTRWASASGSGTMSVGLGYKFVNSMKAKKVRIFNANSTAITVQVKGSNDGITYTNIGSPISVSANGDVSVNLSNNNSYSYMQAMCTGTTIITLYTVQFYGRA